MTKDDQKNILKMDTMTEAQNIALGRRVEGGGGEMF